MSDETTPPNLDLIARVQNARMAHDAETLPSQVSGVYWIEAKRNTEGKPPTPRAGQWVIATTVREVDALWAAVKDATVRGMLGYKSKVSTSSRSGDPDARLIYVVTYDVDDAADVERVRAALVGLGVTGEITYQR